MYDINEVLYSLSQWGVPLKETLERFVEDSELYMDCLKIFSNDPNFITLGQTIISKEYNKAFDAVHTLKGVSGNLGLIPLYEPISKMVESLRAKDYSSLKQQYKNIMDIKKQYENILNSY